MSAVTGARPVRSSAGLSTDAQVSRRRWSIGPVFVLRHAGLPFDWLEELTAPAPLLARAEAVLDAEDRLHAAAEHVPGGRRLARRAVEALDPDRLPARPHPAWEQARAQWGDAVRAYLDAHADAEAVAGEALRRVLSRPQVQEAVFWSNPDVYANMLRPYLDGPRPLNARWRRARRQLYTYVQRLCAKNETVSFFGPMAYGRVQPEVERSPGPGAGTEPGARVEHAPGAVPRQQAGAPGPDGVLLRTDLPTRRRIFLAHWAAREIAAAVARDARLRTVLPFRRTGLPLPAVPGGDHGPGDRDHGLGERDHGLGDRDHGLGGAEGAPVEAALRVLGGAGPDGADLRTIATALGLGVRETALLLQPLVSCGVLEFGLMPDPYDLHPLDALLARLARSPGPDAQRWAGRIRALRDLLGELETTGFPDRIATVGRIEAAFEELTGRPARRGSGAVYADRAVFYEECSSPFDLAIGADVARRWAARITAALELSTGHGERAQARAVREVVAQLGPGARLTLPEYGERLREAFDPGGSRFDAAHAPAYPVRDRHDVVGELLAQARHTPGDRYVLVDLCPAVGDVGDLGSAELVLSRCHHHLLTDGWLATMYPGSDFGADAAGWVADHPELVGVDVGRRNKGYYRFPGSRVPLRAPSAVDADDPDLIRAQQLTVRTLPGSGGAGPRLRCAGPDGHEVALYLPLSDYVKYPPYAALSHPQVLHAAFEGEAFCPAVTVGAAVYQRPRWVLDPAALTQALPAARFLQLRRLARRMSRDGLGDVRFLFCRTESERKPYLVDLASVLAADLVAHLAAGSSGVIAEQMLPGPDHLWLKDSQGRRYTSELRMHVIGREQR